jgi:hypothetical protein
VIQNCIFGVDKHRGSVVISRLILTILGQTSGQPSLKLKSNLKQGDALFGMRRPNLNQDPSTDWLHVHDGSPFEPPCRQDTLNVAVGQHASDDTASTEDLLIDDSAGTQSTRVKAL